MAISEALLIVTDNMHIPDFFPQSEAPHEAKPRAVNDAGRRNGTAQERTNGTRTGGFMVIDLARRQVTWNGTPIDLTATEFRLLEILAPLTGGPLPRDFNLARSWGADYEDEVELIRRSTSSLGTKMKDNLALRRVLWFIRSQMRDRLALQRRLLA